MHFLTAADNHVLCGASDLRVAGTNQPVLPTSCTKYNFFVNVWMLLWGFHLKLFYLTKYKQPKNLSWIMLLCEDNMVAPLLKCFFDPHLSIVINNVTANLWTGFIHLLTVQMTWTKTSMFSVPQWPIDTLHNIFSHAHNLLSLSQVVRNFHSVW